MEKKLEDEREVGLSQAQIPNPKLSPGSLYHIEGCLALRALAAILSLPLAAL